MGNRKNKSHSQKRKFIGNRFTERTKPLDVPTVIDGTWQRRGHSSLNGCVSVLSIDTGKVLDLEVMSKWCRNCNTSKSSRKSKHVKKHQCSYNHQGSAGSMESVGAYRLFERATSGVGSKLRILKTKEKGLGGMGKLSDSFIDKIQNYYGIAIRSNIGNLEEMQRAVIAAFYHCCSGKSNPMYGQCPLGSESWCAYQGAQSAGKVFYDKNSGLPKSIINKIKLTYLQLCDQNLLRKCLHGKTQNANEAFNGCLWNVVPKEIFVELQTFSLGSYIAVINFNKGFTGLLSVLEALDIKIGSYTLREKRLYSVIPHRNCYALACPISTVLSLARGFSVISPPPFLLMRGLPGFSWSRSQRIPFISSLSAPHITGSFTAHNGAFLQTRCRLGYNRELLATDHVIFNHGQVTWMTPELQPPPNYPTTPMEGRLSSRQI
ncbi:uncharacterized protein TNCV_65911 [Trichonephila clavipes]|nr:uncharacterized protein TNCV_65911 [Trichonephila clavipes]